jgi:hypothetical protein
MKVFTTPWLLASLILIPALPLSAAQAAAPTPPTPSHGPRSLNTFSELFASLMAGQAVRVVIDYGKCRLFSDGKEVPSPQAIGGMALWPFEYFARKSVGNDRAYFAISETRLIAHRSYGYVLNYVKVRIFEDQSVEITARYLDPKTHEVRMDETFQARFNDGSIHFFSAHSE